MELMRRCQKQEDKNSQGKTSSFGAKHINLWSFLSIVWDSERFMEMIGKIQMVGSQIVKMWSGMRWHCTDVQSLHRTKCSKFKESYLVSVLSNKAATESLSFWPNSHPVVTHVPWNCPLGTTSKRPDLLPNFSQFVAKFSCKYFTICRQISRQICRKIFCSKVNYSQANPQMTAFQIKNIIFTITKYHYFHPCLIILSLLLLKLSSLLLL